MKKCENCNMYKKLAEEATYSKKLYLKGAIDLLGEIELLRKYNNILWGFFLVFLFIACYLGSYFLRLSPTFRKLLHGPTYYPASYSKELKNVISVGALNKDGNLYERSNYGGGVTTLAPGNGVFSTKAGGGYQYRSGTSMATPQVTGALVLLKSKYPEKNMQEILSIFKTCHKKQGKSQLGQLDLSKCKAG